MPQPTNYPLTLDILYLVPGLYDQSNFRPNPPDLAPVVVDLLLAGLTLHVNLGRNSAMLVWYCVAGSLQFGFPPCGQLLHLFYFQMKILVAIGMEIARASWNRFARRKNGAEAKCVVFWRPEEDKSIVVFILLFSDWKIFPSSVGLRTMEKLPHNNSDNAARKGVSMNKEKLTVL
jgi:hypothetical protein